MMFRLIKQIRIIGFQNRLNEICHSQNFKDHVHGSITFSAKPMGTQLVLF